MTDFPEKLGRTNPIFTHFSGHLALRSDILSTTSTLWSMLGLEANNNVEERTTLNTLEIVGHIFAGLIKLTQEIQGPCEEDFYYYSRGLGRKTT